MTTYKMVLSTLQACKEYREALDKLEAENERLRNALREIIELKNLPIETVRSIATHALNGNSLGGP